MLSRSAERLYWLARYLERTENTARLLSVTMNLIYDLPYGSEVGWHNLLTIFSVEQAFNQRFKVANEQNITRFLLTEDNPNSILSSLSYARENMRTSRELMPDEAWEQVNELYLYAHKNKDSLSTRRGRVIFLQDIMRGCQRFTGFMSNAMSHNDSYRFLCLGKNIERADMTTRIMDFGTVLLLAEDRSSILREHEGLLWLNVLKSLSASLMYRKQVRLRIKGKDVLNFLLKDENLPSSVEHCLQEIAYCIKKLPNSAALLITLNELEQALFTVDMANTTPTQLHQLLDSLQNDFNQLHKHISDTWFFNHQVLDTETEVVTQ